jgi:predicted dehydrogenase
MADNEVRYGIIGAGMMGTEHLWNLQHLPGAVVTAAADPVEAQLEWIVAAAGDEGERIATFTDHRELLDSGLVDAVVVVSPNHTHHNIVLDVLERPGMHALVEKPLCTTVADCQEVVDAARHHDGVVWMGLEYRYMPPVARLAAAVAAGEVGRVHMVAIREHRFPFLPKIGDWNRFNRNTGGTLVEKCCHFFDLMNLLTGDTPVAVMASGGQAVNHLDETYDGEVPDIDDHALVIVEYAGGARASLDLCMFAEGSKNQEEVSVVGDCGKVVARVAGRECAPRSSPTTGSPMRAATTAPVTSSIGTSSTPFAPEATPGSRSRTGCSPWPSVSPPTAPSPSDGWLTWRRCSPAESGGVGWVHATNRR